MKKFIGFLVSCFLVSWFQDSWLLGSKVSWFLGCWFLGFLVSNILGFKVSWFLGFKVSESFLASKIQESVNAFKIYWFDIAKIPFHGF